MANIMFKTLGIRVSLVVCGALSVGVIVAQQPADGDQRMRSDVSALGPQRLPPRHFSWFMSRQPRPDRCGCGM
jgi:hypothetical protein